MADDLLAVADALSLPRLVLVAHRYGTCVAALFAPGAPSGWRESYDGGYWLPSASELDELRQGLPPER